MVKRLYEAMFLVDSAEAASDFEAVQSNIKRILERSDAEIAVMRKWDERRLAYEIQRKNRGTFILVYFNAETDKISSIERDVQLSEQVMRVLIIRADHISGEDMDKATPLMMAEKAEQEALAQAEIRREAIEAKKQELAAEKAAAEEAEKTEEGKTVEVEAEAEPEEKDPAQE